ncbi:MAG TPA: hypothetical protein VHE55_09675 [Fimbriimonadaceae bacterium]|nr:hypothetical protein [Fimbriimonadaceae bacterium]
MKPRIVRIERPAYGASVKSKHGDLQPVFGRVPTRSRAVSGLAGVATFLGVTLGLVELTRILGGKLSGPLGVLSVASTVAVAFWCGRKIYSKMAYRAALDLRATDERRIGGALEGERYVGISYCQGIWTYQDDACWDRGLLSIDAGVLLYRGIGPSFQLALSRIRLLEVQRLAFCGPPFVRVHWTGEDGAANCMNLFALGVNNHAEALAKAEEIAKWIRDAEEDPNADPKGSEPFRSSQLGFCHSPAQAVTGEDLVLAYGASFLVASVVLGLAFAVERISSGFSGLLWITFHPIPWAYRVVIERRVRARAKPGLAAPGSVLAGPKRPALRIPRT